MPEDEPLHILMLEDVDTDADLVSRTLENEGFTFEVERVTTREGFVNGLTTFDPDIILADYSLPRFDGMAALDLAQEKWPEIPVVFVSGAIGEERAIETLKQGATDYVLKDQLSRLGPAVRRALREAEERRAPSTRQTRAEGRGADGRTKGSEHGPQRGDRRAQARGAGTAGERRTPATDYRLRD